MKSHEQIEALVLARNTAAALPAIREYATTVGKDPDKLVRVCDWYRRLGFMNEGLKLTEPTTVIRRSAAADTFTGRKLLWCTRFLNLMGASAYAFELSRRIEPVSWMDYRILGNLYLSNFEAQKALPYFRKMKALCSGEDRLTYGGRLSNLDLADALFAVGEEKEALKLVDETMRISNESYAKAICFQIQGSYHARAGRLKKAEKILKQSLASFPLSDESPDRAFCLKWLAYTTRSKPMFAEALRLLKRSDIRAEAWLDVLRLQDELGMLSSEEAALLRSYPSIAPGLRKRISPANVVCKQHSSSDDLVIDLSADEWWQGERAHLSVSLELRFLALVAAAGQWGVSLQRLKPLLWPEQLSAYSLLDERLRKLRSRVEKLFQAQFQMNEGFLILTSPKVRVLSAEGPIPPRFLREAMEPFTAAEVGQFYGLKRTQRAHYLNCWLVRGWVVREGSLQRPLYRTTNRSARAKICSATAS